MRAQLLRMHHDDPLAGHFGRDRTAALLRRKYWWPKLEKDVEVYCKTCYQCQRMKSKRHRPYGEAHALPFPDRPWQEITMDFITDLPPSRREGCVYDAILVIVDRFSKMVLYIPTVKTVTSAELATILIREVVRRFGVPEGTLSDRGSVFTSQYWSDFCCEAHVTHKLSTAFHPQTDGQTERANQTLEQYLRCFCNGEQNDWATLLPQAEYASNACENDALRMSPFEIVLGYQPALFAPRGEASEGKVPAAAERAQQLRSVTERLKERWRESVNSRAAYHDARHKRREYAVGDLVMLSTRNLRLPVPKKKMAARFVGPFRILDAIGTQAYRLALPSQYRVHNVFHVSLLEPWQGRAGEEPAEPMPLAEEEHEWVVEKIRDTRVHKGIREYLVQWKDWPEDYNTWQSEDDCENAPRKIEAFWAREKKDKGLVKSHKVKKAARG